MFELKKATDAELVSKLLGRPVRLTEQLMDLMGMNLRTAHKVCDGEHNDGSYEVREVLEIARELTVRAMAQKVIGAHAFFQPTDVKDYMRAMLAGKAREEFWCLWLDSQNGVIEAECMSLGSLNQAIVHPREIVRGALKRNAAACILSHNHPSGNANPSRADELLTLTLKNALALVDVKVIDHIIVGSDGAISMAEMGLV